MHVNPVRYNISLGLEILGIVHFAPKVPQGITYPSATGGDWFLGVLVYRLALTGVHEFTLYGTYKGHQHESTQHIFRS